ncbi:MAG: DUF6273 domain-containing protein [Phascolarctobacterium sp.]|nr:DUF6273 domain-containing protein [Phascolarctobacterium sp.]
MKKLEQILEYIDDSILKRAFLFLEEGDWVKANAYLEEVLNQNPENGLAYLGKLMIDTQAHTCVELMDLASPFEENLNYKRCIRYVEEEIAEELKGYNVYIKERNVIVGNAAAYNEALKLMNNAKSEEDYNRASAIFEKLGNYENAAQLVKECLDGKMRIKFGLAEGLFNSAYTEQDFYEAAKAYEEVSDYYDVEDKIEKCNQRAEEAKQAYLTIVENRKRILKLIQKVIIGVIALVIMIFSAKYVYNNFLRYTSLEQAKVGDFVKFGKNSRHGIAWKIYEVQGSKRLLISEDEIGETEIEWRNNVSSWETSSLRQWLNNNFFVVAFNKSEKKLIKLTNLEKNVNGEYNYDVSDLLFLLSVEEVEKYFKNDSQRRWDMNSDGKKFVNWMTRTPCNLKKCFVSVCDNGSFDMRGINHGKACPVRVALWADVKSTDSSDIELYLQKENERKEKIRLEKERIAEEKRKAEEEERLRIAEEKRKAEEAERERLKIEEEKRKAEEAERLRIAEEKRANKEKRINEIKKEIELQRMVEKSFLRKTADKTSKDYQVNLRALNYTRGYIYKLEYKLAKIMAEK